MMPIRFERKRMGSPHSVEAGEQTGAESRPSQANIEGKRHQKSSLDSFSHAFCSSTEATDPSNLHQ